MPPEESPPRDPKYTVVARRYRPQSFDSLIGQEPIVRTLKNAVASDRVGHAYLFTGSRGVGKTSAARIFAKVLNCPHAVAQEPCNDCDSCISISTGEDLDVLEIDGASNRGIDEIRQLRANVSMRPSRSRFKVYIIDEVHMLSRDAFNALLKTLEEPPPHVKFVFCTTDVEKVPITVLSRCQRFDFAPIPQAAIVQRLAEIVAAEQAEAAPEALRLLARRAEGSLRDSQSLLEQVLASTSGRITVEEVHSLFGTARTELVRGLVDAFRHGDAAMALQILDRAVGEGVEVGQLCEQLLTYLRDMMIVGVGATPSILRAAQEEELPDLTKAATEWGLPTILNAVQLLEATFGRLRLSGHRRTLLEIALVQLANLESLQDLAQLAAELKGGPAEGGGGSAKKKIEPRDRNGSRPQPEAAAFARDTDSSSDLPRGDGLAARSSESASGTSAPPVPPPHLPHAQRESPPNPPPGKEALMAAWQGATHDVGGLVAEIGRECLQVTWQDPDDFTVHFNDAFRKNYCAREDVFRRLVQSLQSRLGRELRLRLDGPGEAERESEAEPVLSVRERIKRSYDHPLVREAVDLFEAEVTDVKAGPTK